jgi:hypothetical protein
MDSTLHKILDFVETLSLPEGEYLTTCNKLKCVFENRQQDQERYSALFLWYMETTKEFIEISKRNNNSILETIEREKASVKEDCDMLINWKLKDVLKPELVLELQEEVEELVKRKLDWIKQDSNETKEHIQHYETRLLDVRERVNRDMFSNQ